MGNLGADTAIEQRDEGRYGARLSKEWEIWGPMGGYVAAIALRAAGAHAGVGRPASFFCHYLSVAAFDEVDIGSRSGTTGPTSTLHGRCGSAFARRRPSTTPGSTRADS